MIKAFKRLFNKPKPIAVLIDGFRDMCVYYDDTSYRKFDYNEAKQPKIPYEHWKFIFNSGWHINEELALGGIVRNYEKGEIYTILSKNGSTYLLLYQDDILEYPFSVNVDIETNYIVDKTDDNIKFLEENGFF